MSKEITQAEIAARFNTRGLEILEPYIAAKVKVLARCLKCGHEYKVLPYNVSSGTGCPQCAGFIHLSEFEVKNRLKDRRLEILEPYTNNDASILTRCLECSYEWHPRMGNIFNGMGCPRCSGRIITHEQLMKRCAKAGVEAVGIYRGNRKPWLVRCLTCGKEWSPPAENIFKESGCRQCNQPRIFLDKAEVLKRCAENKLIVLGEYNGIKERLLVQCMICHHRWSPSAGGLMRGSKCPKCVLRIRSEKQQMTHEDFVNRIATINDRIRIVSKYRGALNRVDATCLICFHKWSPLAASLSDGRSCPRCAIPGFRFDKPGTLYYVRISNPFGDPLYKIGITNKTIRKRFGREFLKMTIIETWHFSNGAEAFEMEQDILKDYDADRWTGPDVLSDGNNELFTLDVLGLDKGAGQLEMVA